PTIADELSGVVFGSWEWIDFAATSSPGSILVSCGQGMVKEDPWPGLDAYRPDAHTIAVALDYLTKEKPGFAFIGLGDTDEHAHRGDHNRYLAALRLADQFLADLDRIIDTRTTVFVTADHGRNAAFRDHGGPWPESGRVWLAAKGGAIKAR